jgi:hypothetical protein
MFAKSKISQSMIDAVNNVLSTEEVNEAAPIKEPTPTGMRVYGTSYGNSAKAKQDQTKSSVDDVKEPTKKDIEKDTKMYKDNDNGVKKNYKRKSTGDYFAGDYKKKEEPRYKSESAEFFKDKLINNYLEEDAKFEQELHEVLKKDATAGDWIHDFVHSDNPKFAGKSTKKRQKMALAAYYAKQRNEEVEIDEASKPDFLDMDKDGDKKEPMKQAVKQSKMKEELKGGQKKIDKNHNNKIDAQDFAILRGQKNEAYELADGDVTTDTLAGREEGGKSNDVKSFKLKIKGLTPKVPGIVDPEKEMTSRKPHIGNGGEVEIKKGEVVGTFHKEEVELDEETPAKNTDIADKSYLKDMGKKPTIKSDLKNFKNFLTGKKETNEETELEEAVSRKDFQLVADLIKTHDNHDKRKELAAHHAEIFHRQNPRFDRAKFMKAANVNEGKAPETDSVPFEQPYNTTSDPVIVDKSGAKHTPMSRARDLARAAMKKVKSEMLGVAPGNNG